MSCRSGDDTPGDAYVVFAYLVSLVAELLTAAEADIFDVKVK